MPEGRWIFINGNNTPRVVRIDLKEFKTTVFAAMLGYTGALFEQVFGTALGLGLALGLLLLWTAAPAWMGGRAFRAKDL